MAEPIGAILIVLVVGITLVALFAALSLLIPSLVSRTRLRLETAPGRSFLIGLVNFVFFFALAAFAGEIAKKAPQPIGSVFGLVAGLILFGLIALTAAGVTGLVSLTSHRMNGSVSPLNGTLRAGLLLVLAALAPFAGWFVFAPLALLTSLGAAIQAVALRQRPASPPESQQPPSF